MLLSFTATLLPFLPFLITSVKAQRGQTCNATSLCMRSAPCCSEFGFCGYDQFCLGGCNPLHSFSLDSCTPEPRCRDAQYTFPDNSRILTNVSYYDGNASAHDWVVDKGQVFNTNANGGELVMILTKENGGTRLSSTRYVHYGTITARLKTGRWAGVVTAFITMSDIKDEIDWEFPGNQVTQGQSNYFWQGVVTQPTHGETHSGISDTYGNYHDYTIDWQPSQLTFSIDGNVVRTIKQSDTIVNGASQYPNTPSRIQLSLWPAGINSSAPGVVQWAGGMINWNDPDYVSAGHFYALVSSVTVKCADSQAAGPNITSYVYGSNTTADTPSINFSNHSTLVNAASSFSAVNLQVKAVITIVFGLMLASWAL